MSVGQASQSQGAGAVSGSYQKEFIQQTRDEARCAGSTLHGIASEIFYETRIVSFSSGGLALAAGWHVDVNKHGCHAVQEIIQILRLKALPCTQIIKV